MARDHYGTHDEIGRGPSRRGKARARDVDSVSSLDRGRPSIGEGYFGRHSPNYGSDAERVARTQDNSGAAFQARDYERDNYGGGYGVQRRTRDVPAAGRKGEWMHAREGHANAPAQKVRPQSRPWRGQTGGGGMDGLASERAFGSESDQQMSAIDADTSYRRWRDAELRAHDEEYRNWRRKQAQRYDADYERWRSRRGRENI